MALKQAGTTTNFVVNYEDSLPDPSGVHPATNVIANANALLGVVENEFTVTTGWFNTPSGKFGTGNRQVVNLNLPDTVIKGDGINEPGANNTGYGHDINLDAQNLFSDLTVASGRVENLFMAEWSEVLMSVAGNWNARDSSGEGLSQFCSILRFQTGHYNYYGSSVEQWLNGKSNWPIAARSDWVNTTYAGGKTDSNGNSIRGDGDPVSFGCALAFIYYLSAQFGFSINQIIAAYNSNMANAYHTLTGDPGNPFPPFLALIESVYPASQTPSPVRSPITPSRLL